VTLQQAFCVDGPAFDPVKDDEAVKRSSDPPRARSSKVWVRFKSAPAYFRIAPQDLKRRIYGLGETSRQRQCLSRVETSVQKVPAKLPFHVSVEAL
jgi:hypothetical protein